jgi:sulfatase maturation enzyme AslB (radical SAM superfamily)
MSKLNSSGPSFCSLLWKHICVRPNFVPVPCCRYTGELAVNKSAPLSYDIDINSADLRKIRQKMMDHEAVQGCEECYEEEALTHQSLRLHSNKLFGMDFPIKATTTYDLIEYLEIFVGSTCNLKCISCSPLLSTSLYEEYKKNNWPIPAISELSPQAEIDFIEKLTNLKHLKFVGGEPILNKLHDKIIESLDKSQINQICLTYYTNCTVWPNPKTLSVWKNAHQVTINISVDGVGEKNEFLRKNSNWKKVDEMARRYFELAEQNSNITLQISTTVSILNLLSLNEIDIWFNSLSELFPRAKVDPVYLTYLMDPPSLAPHNAPQELIERAIETYESSGTEQQLKIVNLLKTVKFAEGSDGKKNFLDYVGRFEESRKNSFRETFPEIGIYF